MNTQNVQMLGSVEDPFLSAEALKVKTLHTREFIRSMSDLKRDEIRHETLNQWLSQADYGTRFWQVQLLHAVHMGKLHTAQQLAGPWIKEAAKEYGGFKAYSWDLATNCDFDPLGFTSASWLSGT